MKRCGAKNRAGGPCGRPAGWGTDHGGRGRCRSHGGKSGTLKHGRYSRLADRSVGDLVAQMEADPEPLDCLAELAMARALLKAWLERYAELRELLFAWAEDPAGRPRPARAPEILEVVPLLEGVSKAVARIQRAQADGAISRPDFFRMMTEMGRTVDLCVDDPDVRQLIHDGWLELGRG